MIIRSITAILTAALIANTAAAQSSQSNLAVSTEWEMLPPDQLTCMEQTLRQEGRADIGALVTRGMRPSHPQLKGFMDRCAAKREVTPRQSDNRTDAFVSWFSTDILSKPAFSTAFGQCKAVVSRYQDAVLENLRSRAATLDSKTRQQGLLNAVENLAQRRSDVTNVACIKQFISVLRVAGSQSGYYVDELASLNGKLTNPGFDLRGAARTKVDDLTNEGLARLVTFTALGNLTQNNIQSEISSIGTLGLGYLACLLTNEWVSWFSSASFCHGPVLEGSLIQSVNTVKLP